MLGAGGIGGYYAARLAEAGHHVALTAHGEHLCALKARGLVVVHESQVLQYPLPACSHEELIVDYHPDDFDLIILTLKSAATQVALEELEDWLQSGAVPLLSLQNGVDNELLISKVVGEERVFGGLVVGIGAHITEPGKVFAKGAAQLVMGAWPTQQPEDARLPLLKGLEETFARAGVPTTITDDIRCQLWRKLLIDNGVNLLSALTSMDARSLVHHSDYKDIVYQMMTETVAASRADGADLTEQDLQEVFESISNGNTIETSMLSDEETGRPLELESISGAVLKRSEALGVAAPYTRRVMELFCQKESPG